MNPYMLAGLLAFAYVVGRITMHNKFTREIKEQIWRTVQQSEAFFNQKIIPVNIEKHGQTYFMYEANGNTGFINKPTLSEVFIAQGNTKLELIQNARLNRPGALFFVNTSLDIFEFEKTDLL